MVASIREALRRGRAAAGSRATGIAAAGTSAAAATITNAISDAVTGVVAAAITAAIDDAVDRLVARALASPVDEHQSPAELAVAYKALQARCHQLDFENKRLSSRSSPPPAEPAEDDRPPRDARHASPPASAPPGPDERRARPALDPPRPSTSTIVLAVYDRALEDALGEVLRAQHRLLVADDDRAALLLAERHRPDLVICDLAPAAARDAPALAGTTVGDGLELARRLHALAGGAASILLTDGSPAQSHGQLLARAPGLRAGAFDCLPKPFVADELRARVRTRLQLASLAAQLKKSEELAALGKLAAGLAHDLCNPANAIVNAVPPLLDLLPESLLVKDSPTEQLLEVLAACATQVGFLSRQLLAYQRARGELEREEMPIELVLRHALSLAQPSLSRLTLEKDLAYRGTVWCAAPLLTQVMANLLDNAGKAAGENGWVRLACRAERELLIVEVSDSGPGVPLELRERIFEPFFTTRPHEGTGLGLTMAREIVARHAGVLDVRGTARGSLFHLEIPLHRSNLNTASDVGYAGNQAPS